MSGQHCENYDLKRETVRCYPRNVDRCCTQSERAFEGGLKPRPNDLNISTQQLGGPAFASTGQTIATFERSISQHCWAQHVARVWPPCCDVLRRVGYENSNKCACLGETLLHRPGQTVTTSCNIRKCCMKNLIIFKFEPTKLNTSQYVAIGWPNASNIFLPTMLRYVALKCCDRLAEALRCKYRVN